MLSYGFEEGTDYQVSVFFHIENGMEVMIKKDYALTIDTAKRNIDAETEKGKQARQYFIECEKKRSHDTFRSIKSEMALLIEKKL
jgi:anti-repressor protein